jgi:hypothetical protein
MLDSLDLLALLAEQGPYLYEVEGKLYCHNCGDSPPHGTIGRGLMSTDWHSPHCTWRMAVEKMEKLKKDWGK